MDSELLLGCLAKEGYSVTERPEDADLLLVNTCAFIEPAKEESIEAILKLARIKDSNGDGKLIVTGCLAQRYGSQLEEELPEVDHFLGTNSFTDIGRIVRFEEGPHEGTRPLPRLILSDPKASHVEGYPRIRSTAGGSAYLRISEGCDRSCSYCVIPSIRGPQRSRTIESLVEEARALVEDGVVELNLIAQDLSAYGRDIPSKPHLADLLRELGGVEGLHWIRMLYAYPSPMPDAFFDVWARNEKVLPYLDIPLQHASDSMLRLMRRGSSIDQVRRDLAKMRKIIGAEKGGLTLRTTFLVGHPKETSDDFDRLIDFVEEMRFENVGVFVYSDEEGTAAFDMPEKVPSSLAEERRARLMETQQRISAEHQAKMIGRRLDVLVEGVSEESDLVIQGRHAGQAPEIDGVVYLEGQTPRPGSIVEVEITDSHAYDLIGMVPEEFPQADDA